MYTLNINLMDMLINLNVHYLQYQRVLKLQDMFVEKIEKLNQEKKLNKLPKKKNP